LGRRVCLELKRPLIGVIVGGSVMTDAANGFVGKATRPKEVAGRATSDDALIRVLYDDHGPALWRYAIGLTGDQARSEDVVRETLLRAWQQHPEVVDDRQRSTRTWLFIVARNMITDERRSSRFRSEVAPPDIARTMKRAASDDVNLTPDRLLIGDAMAQLPAEHRAVIRRSCYLSWSTSKIAEDLGIAEATVKSRLHHGMRALRLTLQEMGVTR
jgi:RNA polymerase sigma-70 factor (ECF subfamily)